MIARALTMRALLFVALAASFLATGVLGASQTSYGTDKCGLSQTWTMAPGETRKCCTASSLGSVTRFRYTVKPTSSTFNGKEMGVVTHARACLYLSRGFLFCPPALAKPRHRKIIQLARVDTSKTPPDDEQQRQSGQNKGTGSVACGRP